MYNKDHFYNHLIDLSDLEKLMHEYEVPEEEHEQLLVVVHKTIHIEVTKLVLDELDEEYHEEFLAHLETRPHDEGLMSFLKRTVDNIEHRIQHVAETVKHDFKESLHEYGEASEEWFKGEDIKRW